MKNIKKIFLLMIVTSIVVSCEEKGDFLTENKNEGGLISVEKKIIGYVIGNGDAFEYKNSISAEQIGNVKVTNFSIYKSFVNSNGTATPDDDKTSNEVFLKTVPVPTDKAISKVDFSVTYPELIQGLKVNGVAVPTTDTSLNIGDYFILRYEQLRSDGQTVRTSGESSTKIAVGTRLAGAYKAIDAGYWRIGVLAAGGAANWPAETIIESVDANTYKVIKRFGSFGPIAGGDDNTWTFDVNGTVISYPDAGAETGNGQPFITCTTNPADFAATANNCAVSNKVVLDNVNGKDKLYMTFGYYTGAGAVGARIFYQVLEKI
jgi:hypothetical protein